MRKVKISSIILLLGAALFVGCANRLELVNQPANPEKVAKLDLANVESIFIASGTSSTAGAMGIASKHEDKDKKKLYVKKKVKIEDQIERIEKRIAKYEERINLYEGRVLIELAKGEGNRNQTRIDNYNMNIFGQKNAIRINQLQIQRLRIPADPSARTFEEKRLQILNSIVQWQTNVNHKTIYISYLQSRIAKYDSTLTNLNKLEDSDYKTRLIANYERYIANDNKGITRQEESIAKLNKYIENYTTLYNIDLDQEIASFLATYGDQFPEVNYGTTFSDATVAAEETQAVVEDIEAQIADTSTEIVPATYLDANGNPIAVNFTPDEIQLAGDKYIIIKNTQADGTKFNFIIVKETSAAYIYGDDVLESATLQFNTNGDKFYYCNLDYRLVEININPQANGEITKTVLPALDGVSYSKAKIDKDGNIVVGDKFIKKTGGFVNIPVADNGADVFVNRNGVFNYVDSTTGEAYSIKTDANNDVQYALIGESINSALTAAKSLGVINNNSSLLTVGQVEYQLVQTKLVNGYVVAQYLYKWDGAFEVSKRVLERTDIVAAGSDKIYILSDGASIGTIDLDTLATQPYHTSSLYSITNIGVNSNDNLYFYGLKFEDGSSVEVEIDSAKNEIELAATPILAGQNSYLTKITLTAK